MVEKMHKYLPRDYLYHSCKSLKYTSSSLLTFFISILRHFNVFICFLNFGESSTAAYPNRNHAARPPIGQPLSGLLCESDCPAIIRIIGIERDSSRVAADGNGESLCCRPAIDRSTVVIRDPDDCPFERRSASEL